jgi:cobalt-zinc-cadmium efflux system protein
MVGSHSKWQTSLIDRGASNDLWEIASGFLALSAHVLVKPNGDCHQIRRDLEKMLNVDYAISHTTLQVDHVSDPTVSVESVIAMTNVHLQESTPSDSSDEATGPNT